MSALTDQQRDELQRQLLALRLALEARSQACTQDTQPVSLDQPIGRLTRMAAIQQQQTALGQQQRLEEELQQVIAALHRVDQQHYGLCLRCHEAIPYARLAIRPTATLCYDCQCELESRSQKL